MKKNLLGLFIVLLILSGCAENHYYHKNHRHTDRYYHRHHQTPPAIEIDVHHR